MWIILSLLAGLMNVFQDSYSKKGLISNKYSDWTVMLARFLYVLPFFVAMWVVNGLTLEIRQPSRFTVILTVLVFLEVISQFCYHQAIKQGSLSLVKPFLSLTPMAILPVAYVLRGEIPTFWSSVGVILTCIGLWVLVAKPEPKEEKKEMRKAKKATNRPVVFITVTSLLWAFTTTLQKTGAELAGVPLFGFCYALGVVLVILLYHGLRKISIRQLFDWDEMKILFPIGLFAGLSSLFQFKALTLTNPAYPNAIKRIPNILHLMGDKKVFKDDRVNFQRVAGNFLSLAGTLLIILGS